MAGDIRKVKYMNDGTFGQIFPTDFELDKEFVVKAILEKTEHVINCVGTWQEPKLYQFSQSWFSMEAINVEWPRMLARWCREMGVNRLIHVSMVGADVNSTSKLLRQKALAEQAVLEEFPRATIIRCTDVFGQNDAFYTNYFKAVSYCRVVPVPNNGQRIHQPVFAGDIAEACARAVCLDHTEGRIAELGGPIRWTTNDMMKYAAECVHLYNLALPLPKWMLKIMCEYNERVPFKKTALSGCRAPVWNRDWLERQYIDNVAMPERDPELLDWEDFGIPREDLYKMEEKYFYQSGLYAKEWSYATYGRHL